MKYVYRFCILWLMIVGVFFAASSGWAQVSKQDVERLHRQTKAPKKERKPQQQK